MANTRSPQSREIGDISETLDAMDSEQRNDESEARSAERFKYRIRDVSLEIMNSNGLRPAVAAQARNISKGGVSLIVRQMIYPGSKCRVKLISVINHTVTQPGIVVRTRYLSGTARLYEIGIQFDSPINVALFHHGTTPTRILLLCDELMYQVLKGFLSKEHVHFAMAKDRESFANALRAQEADIAVTDRPVDEMVELATALRSEAVPTPLLALVAGADDEVRSALQDAGFDAIVNLPPTRDEVRTAIAAHQCEPLTSSLILDADMLDVIDAFVLRMPEYIEAVRSALTAGQIEPIRESLRRLQIGASCAGFEALDTVIREAFPTLEGEPEMTLVSRKITQILRMCSRATGASCQCLS